MKIKYLLYIGLVLLILSFIYDVIFINIPFQDPSPQMIENRDRQYFIKDSLFYCGLIVTACGLTERIINKINKKPENGGYR
jgi:hypothetical protein